MPVAPYLESRGTDGKVYRAQGIPTFATSTIFMKAEGSFTHGLDERIPVRAFTRASHHYRLAKQLGGR